MTIIRGVSRWLAVSVTGALVLAGCGGDDDDDAVSTEPPAGSTGGTATAGAVDLSDVCPENVIIQTDWYPESEHGWVYQMVGDDYEIDKDALAVRGSLVASGGADTGVHIEIRTGGPAIGNQTVTSQLYTDDDILLGYVYTDEAIQFSAEFPTVAIYAGMEKNPQMIMWDPATYPEVETIADLGPAGVEAGKVPSPVLIRYFEGAAYMDYFRQAGILTAEQLDGSYDGSPANFIAAEGKDAQQGFGSAEPYKYEHEFTDWGKPVAYQYVNDAGWNNYGESIATRPENIEEYGPCFEKLVPVIQQSSVDYIADPAETNALVLEAVEKYDSFWTYTQGVADFAVQAMQADGLLGNGPDGTVGNFDLDRVDELIALATPVYESLGQAPAEGLTADDVVTNQFIDESIGFQP